MSELLKQVALDGCGIAWLPEYAIQQEIRSGKLVVLNRDELVIPIQAYAYRMNTRMNPVAERFWRELRERRLYLADILQRRTTPTAIIPDQIKR